MAVNLSPIAGAGWQFFDNDGNPLSGGLLYTYAAGTSTPLATYTSANGNIANSNPIVMASSGRPPQEVWLTDTFAYKFVLKDANLVQIASWDNIVGINSNFQAFSLQEETQTATQGQTVFTLIGFEYQAGANNLSVFVNGSKQISGLNYAETSSSVVTFADGLNVGDIVDFTTSVPIATNPVDSSNVSYVPGGLGAVATTVQAKLRQTLNVKDYGAIGNGIADDTNAIQYGIDQANAIGAVLTFPAGTYKVTNGITSFAIDAVSNVKLQGIKGAVTIKLASTNANCAIIGSASSIENFEIDGIIFDGNKSVVTTYDTYGCKFDYINSLQVTNCEFKNFRMDGILAGIVTLAKNVLIDSCIFTDIGVAGVGANGVRVYNNEGLVINNCDFYNFIVSPIDTNPTTIDDLQTNVVITNNYIENDSVNWRTGFSAISLLNDRTLVQGNTIVGGGSGGQVVVHNFPGGRSVRDYRIIGNSFLNSTGTAIVINQDANADIIVSSNTIKGAVGNGIQVVNANTPPYTNSNPTVISNNIIEDSSTATYTFTSQPACINIGQSQNVIVSNNQCITPRWAGVVVQSACNKISIQGNSIIGQQGQAPTDFATFHGGAIVVSPGGLAYAGNTTDVLINGNFIYNFLTTVSPPLGPTALGSVRCGGIAVYNDNAPTSSVNNITVTNNVVRKGNGIGIQTYYVENSTIDGNTITDTFGEYYDTSSTSVLVNPTIGFYSAAPTTGSWQQGTALYNAAASSGGYVGWVCTTSGTFGTLTGVTGTISINSNVLTVNSATNLALGQYIKVVGVTPLLKIIGISGTTISVDALADASATTAAVSFQTPAFKTFGLIS